MRPVTDKRTPPNPLAIEQAMSVAMAFQARLETAEADADTIGTIDAQTDVLELLTRLGRYALDNKATAEAAHKRRVDLQARESRFLLREAHARSTIFAMMDALGMTQHADPEFTASVRNGVAGVVIIDETAIPPEYFETVRAISKRLIADAIKAGTKIPGAALMNGAPSLSIRST